MPAMNQSEYFDFVTNRALKPAAAWTNKQRAQFHAFNPNGLSATRRLQRDRVTRACEAGKVPFGWSLAYGWLASTTFQDDLMELARSKRVSRDRLAAILECLQWEIDRVEAKLQSVNA